MLANARLASIKIKPVLGLDTRQIHSKRWLVDDVLQALNLLKRMDVQINKIENLAAVFGGRSLGKDRRINLFKAVKMGDIVRVREVLDKDQFAINEFDYVGLIV